MTLPISYFRFYFPEYVLKTRLPPNCTTGFLDSLTPSPQGEGVFCAAFCRLRRCVGLPLRERDAMIKAEKMGAGHGARQNRITVFLLCAKSKTTVGH